jgi:RNA polymerase sigma-70 factor (sigma-E family)
MRERRQQSRSQGEFDQFVAESVDGLLREAYLVVWDFAAAEDLVQECLLQVARRWPRVRAMEHPRAYARKVLFNLALDEGGRRTRHHAELHRTAAAHIEAHPDDGSARIFGRVEASADLLGALGELPPRQRAALVLRYFEDLSEVQVAEIMGCSVGTVKSTTSRALERLRGTAATQPSRDDQTAIPPQWNPEGSITR